MPLEPHLFLETELPPPRRPWMPLVLSAVLHVLLVVLVVLATRTDTTQQGKQESAAPPHRVDLANLPPYSMQPPKPLPKPAPAQPAPPPQPQPPPQEMPRPQVKRGEQLPEEVLVSPVKPPDAGPLAEPPAERAPDAAAQTHPAPESDPAAVTELAMKSEAQRLFGRNQSGVAYATGPEPIARWAQEMTDDRNNDCIPTRHPVRTPGAPVELGQVTGRVFREGTTQPLSGAFLQILGTSYSTFADDDGWYRLSFDQSLVDDCRTQYVQVSKDGFRPRRLILGLGARMSNDIPMSRR